MPRWIAVALWRFGNAPPPVFWTGIALVVLALALMLSAMVSALLNLMSLALER